MGAGVGALVAPAVFRIVVEFKDAGNGMVVPLDASAVDPCEGPVGRRVAKKEDDVKEERTKAGSDAQKAVDAAKVKVVEANDEVAKANAKVVEANAAVHAEQDPERKKELQRKAEELKQKAEKRTQEAEELKKRVPLFERKVRDGDIYNSFIVALAASGVVNPRLCNQVVWLPTRKDPGDANSPITGGVFLVRGDMSLADATKLNCGADTVLRTGRTRSKALPSTPETRVGSGEIAFPVTANIGPAANVSASDWGNTRGASTTAKEMFCPPAP